MIGIISAMSFEKQGILRVLKDESVNEICGIVFHEGKLGEKDIVLAACGEGKVNAARCSQIMVSHYNVSTIINVGVAGSLNRNIRKGELVLAQSVVQHDFDMRAIEVPLGLVPRGNRSKEHRWGDKAVTYIHSSLDIHESIKKTLTDLGLVFHEGVIATGDRFIADQQEKERIASMFNAIACEMEGAAIALVCLEANVKFAEIRDISDNADDQAGSNFFDYSTRYTLENIILEIMKDLPV